jgi:hypothetical protein
MMSPFISPVSMAHSIYVRRASACIDIAFPFDNSRASSLREASNDLSLRGIGSQCRSLRHVQILSAVPITFAARSGF